MKAVALAVAFAFLSTAAVAASLEVTPGSTTASLDIMPSASNSLSDEAYAHQLFRTCEINFGTDACEEATFNVSTTLEFALLIQKALWEQAEAEGHHIPVGLTEKGIATKGDRLGKPDPQHVVTTIAKME